MLHIAAGNVCVRVRADAEPALDVVVSRQANGLYKLIAQEAQEKVHRDSHSSLVSGASSAILVPIF
jgi:hypothetical protein